jgi:hypothetical protein
VHEVADDRDVDAALLGLGLDPLDLVAGAVHERHRGAALSAVAPLGLFEDAPDHRAGVLDDAGAQPLVGSDRSRSGLVALRRSRLKDVGHRARRRCRVVHHADLCHRLAVSLILPR